MRILVASRNPKKLRELHRLLEAADVTGVELLSIADVGDYPENPEDGRTFEDNAYIKARDGALATGLPCLADDSGLAVDELNGMPGVLSARWAGGHGDDEANWRLLLAQMGDVPERRRGAAFVSTVVLVVPGEGGDGAGAGAAGEGTAGAVEDGVAEVHTCRGEWRGRVIGEPRGANGFGYDPVFVPNEEDSRVAVGRDLDRHPEARTAAELDPSEKDSVSHRARALRQIVPLIARMAEA
ncbi:non-canonical purine NTP pyrophosphatase [Corynebacterium sp.]|uniref:non-canonical purine NTP pyrophosphatase n=1 Tax=Corynebacterium sp. TaxID=1720 RepID=UPI0026DD3D86|nr:non-canonical purine NTP pyrophosphatase [Corynebacterium sp.]MDO4610989.1 non-canonical purine NTP pyrophosphatase [Corynebacterium sp.]